MVSIPYLYRIFYIYIMKETVSIPYLSIIRAVRKPNANPIMEQNVQNRLNRFS